MQDFTVTEIMTAAAQLKRADSLAHAQKLFHEYDVVPSPRRGEIEGFFHKDSGEANPLRPAHLLSDATEILELPKLLTAQPFYFIISGNQITGYVHYSDLNKYVVAIPLFALFRTAERLLWQKIQNRVKETDLGKLFAQKEVKVFLRKRKRAASGNVDLGWTGIFSFSNILKLARYFGEISETDQEIESLRITRNRIAHADGEMIRDYDDVIGLAKVKELIADVLEAAR
jgi:hypothetical protein